MKWVIEIAFEATDAGSCPKCNVFGLCESRSAKWCDIFLGKCVGLGGKGCPAVKIEEVQK